MRLLLDVMAAKFLAYILCLLALTKVDGIEVNSEGKIHMKVVTSAGCGDTGRFVRNQLAPAYELYGEFLDIDFVPWGKVTWPEGVMSCQFGLPDCWANRLHRCVLNALKNDPDTQMKYMLCEFTTPFPSFLQGSYECVRDTGLSLVDIDYCVTRDFDDLDQAAQEASVDVMAAFDYVPAIVFNGIINREEHDEAERRLASMICFALADDPNSGVTSCRIHM